MKKTIKEEEIVFNLWFCCLDYCKCAFKLTILPFSLFQCENSGANPTWWKIRVTRKIVHGESLYSWGHMSALHTYIYLPLRASQRVQWIKNPPAIQQNQVRSLGRKIPWRRKSQRTPIFLPGEFHRIES